MNPLNLLDDEDYDIVARILHGNMERKPDLIIAPDGSPYLYRWHIKERNDLANDYLHLQIGDDPERPLHDHPWDNTSYIISGGYNEILQRDPPYGAVVTYARNEGETISRSAEWSHRLLLPEGMGYTLTRFVTGPVIRKWGFWVGDRWFPHNEVIEDLPDGRSIWTGPRNRMDVV